MQAHQIVRGDHPKIVTTKQRELLDDQGNFMKRSGSKHKTLVNTELCLVNTKHSLVD